MERIEKLELFKKRGYTCSPITGKIYNNKGKEMISLNYDGYIYIQFPFNGKQIRLRGHHFVWYMTYGLDVPDNLFIDHINGNRSDNRICNLRIVTKQKNNWNRKEVKGYSFNKSKNKYRAVIKLDGISINLGYYKLEIDARNAYLKAKNQRDSGLLITTK